LNRCHIGDCLQVLRELPDGFVNTCVTSPPYFGLRDYGHEGQIGLEPTPDEYVAKLVEVFREVRRVLRDDGTLWLNLGDSYAGSWGSQGRQGNTGQMAGRSVADVRERSKIQAARIEAGAYPSKKARTGSIPDGSGLKPKDLIGIPWRVAFALQADGWYLRQDIIWAKPNPMPESVRDRCTKSHEYLFLLSKSERYYFDAEAIKEPSLEPRGPGRGLPGEREGDNSNVRGSLHEIGPRDFRNRRSVWTVATRPYKGAHFATYPPELVEPCVLAGSPEGGVVLDPFFGSGTTGQVAEKLGRAWVGVEVNPSYVPLQRERLQQMGLIPAEEEAA
jgi:DNA modification methylase